MKKTHNKLTCLFGYHDYSKERTVDKHGRFVYMCKHCKRAAYRDAGNVIGTKFRRWYRYDESGTCIYVKFSNGDKLVMGADGFWNGKR